MLAVVHKRRLYGNKTERSVTSELQLALGDMLGGQAQLAKDLEKKVKDAMDAAPPEPEGSGKPRAHGRRDLALLESKLPRVVVEIIDAHMELRGCRRIGFEDSRQFAHRPGGLYILVKRVAKYEVPTTANDEMATSASSTTERTTTVVTTESPRRCSLRACSTPRRSRT